VDVFWDSVYKVNVTVHRVNRRGTEGGEVNEIKLLIW